MSSEQPIFDRLEHELGEGIHRLASHLHHHPQQADTQETPMSFLDDLRNDLAAAAAKVDNLDGDALDALQRAQANPVAMQVITGVADIIHAPNAVQMLANVLSDLKGLFPAEPAAAA